MPLISSDQTHCAFIKRDPKWVAVAFYSVFWISAEVVFLQCCSVVTWCMWCHLGAIHVHHTTMHMSCYFIHLGAIHVHHTTMHHVMLLHSSWCNPCPPYNHAPCHVTSAILVQSMSTIQPCTMSCYFIHLGAIHVHHTTMHHVMLLHSSWCNPCPPYNHAPCHVTSFILVQSMSTIQPCTMSCYFIHLGAIHVHHCTMSCYFIQGHRCIHL